MYVEYINNTYTSMYVENSSLLEYDTMSIGTQLLMFRRNLLPPSSEYTQHKKFLENLQTVE